MRPLTDKEKESGFWNPPQPRVLFEGTLDEAQTFYQQTKWIPHPVNAPLAVYTDGFPIIVPTEEKVKEMLKGTSHRPEEVLTYQTEDSDVGRRILAQCLDGSGKEEGRSDPLPASEEDRHGRKGGRQRRDGRLQAGTSAGGSGHRPIRLSYQHHQLPQPGGLPQRSHRQRAADERGSGHAGSRQPVNSPIGRAYQLMAINLGGAIPGVNRMGCMGSPLNNGGTCYAENAEGLPPGWKGLNEEFGFKKDESVVMVQMINGGVVGSQFSPGGYRAFQKSGHGGLARRFDVKGKPGPHNWLEYIVPGLWATREGGFTIVMVPEMAQHLYDIGFQDQR